MDKAKKLQEIILKGDLYALFTGAPGYYKFAPYADMPTDPDYVFDAFVEYSSLSNDLNIWETYKDVVIEVSKDSVYSWMALYYVDSYIRLKPDQKLTSLDVRDWLNTVISNLKLNKENLIVNREWQGLQWSNGLWGDVEHMVKMMNDSFNLNIRLD